MKIAEKQNIKNQSLIIAGVVIIILIFLFFNFVYSPMQTRKREVKTQLDEANGKLAEAQSIADKKEIIERDLTILQHKISLMGEMLPQKKEIPSLLKMITTKANESGVKIASFKPGTIAVREFYNEIPIEVTVRAGYNSLGVFFTKIGSLYRIVNIENVQISPLGSEVNRETINASFVIKAFTYAEGGGF